jgi:type I restriction enzyme S subunit
VVKIAAHKDYKPADSLWLPEIPATWQQIRGRFVMGVNPSPVRLRDLEESDEVSFVPMEVVGERGGLSLDRSRPIDEIGSGYTEFEDGDVVVAKITPCFENGKLALLMEYRQALITSAVTGKINVRDFSHSRASGNPEGVAHELA